MEKNGTRIIGNGYHGRHEMQKSERIVWEEIVLIILIILSPHPYFILLPLCVICFVKLRCMESEEESLIARIVVGRTPLETIGAEKEGKKVMFQLQFRQKQKSK